MIYDLDGMLPARAFQRDARGQIKPQGGGGPSAPTNQNVTTTSIPEYARPYVEKSLGQAAALTDISQNPYQPYQGQRTAAFTPMQAQAMQNVSGMQTSGQLTDASNLAYTAGQQGLGAQGAAQQLQNTALGYGQAGAGYGAAASQFGAEGAQQAQQASQRAQRQASMYGSQGAQYGAQGANQALQAQRAAEGQADMYGQMGAGYGTQAAGLAPEAQRYGAGAAQMGQQGMGIGQRGVSAAEQGFQAQQDYQKMATSPEAQQAYMSPYMQNVVDVQSKEARRQADISQQGNKSRAVAAGAFGGNRAALVEAEGERGLQDRLAGIQAQGSQSAFEKAQQAQQFGSNLGIQGLQAGYQGLQAGMQGTGQGIQGAQAGMQGVGQAGQMYGLGMQGAGLGLQGTGQRLAAANVGLTGTGQGMQGAGLGLQGVGQQIAGGQLGLQGAQTGIQGQQAGMQGTAQGLSGVQAATGAGQYGLQGAGAATQAAGALGQLGQTQFGQETAITDAQMKAGQMQQGQEQRGLDLQYQQYQDSLNYPYKQLGFMSDMYRGLPLTQGAQSMYQADAPPAQQLMGLGLGAVGLKKAFGP
jgi:hypothetical protein